MKYLNEVSTPELIKLIKQNLATKQDLITSPVNNNLAGMDSTGQTIDSGISTDTIKDNIYDTKSYTDQSFLYRESLSEEDCVGKLDTIKGNSLVFNQKVWKEENADILKIKGNTVKFNQLVQNGNFADTSVWVKVQGTLTVSNNIGTFTNNGSDPYLRQNIAFINSHYYYFSFECVGNELNCLSALNLNYHASVGKNVLYGRALYNAYQFIDFRNNQATEIKLKNVQVFDLTLIFGSGSEPTQAQFETWLSNNIGLLPYYDYTLGDLISFNGTGLKTVGFNQWDEEWRNCDINGDTGEIISGSYVVAKNFISVLPNTVYYACVKNYTNYVYVYQYSADLTYLGRSTYKKIYANTIFTTDSKASYILFLMGSVYGTTYNNNICINISNAELNGTYEPYTSNTLSLPILTYFPTGMKEAGSMYDELTENKATTRVGRKVASDFSTTQTGTSTGGLHWADCSVNGQISSLSDVINNIGLPMASSPNAGWVSTVPCLSIESIDTSYPRIRIYLTDTTSVATQYPTLEIYYGLATPTEQDISVDLTYPVYRGGTEQLLPVNGATPVTSPLNAIIDYPYGIEETEFVYKQTVSTITLINGHSYITRINGTWSNVSGTGQTLTVSDDDMVIDLTQMANPYITNYSQFTQFYPETYEFEKGRLVSFTGTGLKTTNADESESSTLILPTYDGGLKSAGSVYDELNESKYIKRIGVVDLGTLDWQKGWYADSYRIYAQLDGKKAGLSNMMCSRYPLAKQADNSMPDKTITGNNGNTFVYIKDSSYSSSGVDSLIASLSGVYLVYELATPIETEATTDLSFDAYKDGTEEILSTSTTTPDTSPIVTDMSYLGTKDTIDLSYNLLKETKEEIGVLELNSIYYGNETEI